MYLRPTSLYVDADGPVHVADYGGDAANGTVVCVHGLGNSHASWHRFAEALTPHHRVLAVDLPGHGRTPRHGRSAAVEANVDLFGRVLEQLSADPVALVGHSMGATLALLHAARRPETVRALAVVAAPMPRARAELVTPALASRVALCAWPWLAARVLTRRRERLGAEEFVRRGLQLTCASLESIDLTTRQMIVELVESQASGVDSEVAFVEAARSIGLLVARAASYRQAIAEIDLPGVVVHGAQDRLLSRSGEAQLAELQPGWRTRVLHDVGHSPHLEAPEHTASIVRTFLRDLAAGEDMAPDRDLTTVAALRPSLDLAAAAS